MSKMNDPNLPGVDWDALLPEGYEYITDEYDDMVGAEFVPDLDFEMVMLLFDEEEVTDDEGT